MRRPRWRDQRQYAPRRNKTAGSVFSRRSSVEGARILSTACICDGGIHLALMIGPGLPAPAPLLELLELVPPELLLLDPPVDPLPMDAPPPLQAASAKENRTPAKPRAII